MLHKSLLIVLLVVCVQLTVARPRKSDSSNGRHRSKSLRALACRIDDEITKICGCNNEERTECTLGPLTLTVDGVNGINATFCEAPNDEISQSRGPRVLAAACRIETTAETPEILRNKTCRGEDKCGSDVNNFLTTTINNNDVKVFFCDDQLQLEDNSDRSDSSSEDNEEGGNESHEGGDGNDMDMTEPLTAEEGDDDCVCLSCSNGRGGRRSGAQERNVQPAADEEDGEEESVSEDSSIDSSMSDSQSNRAGRAERRIGRRGGQRREPRV